MVFGISWTDALVLGAVLAAVSPAVVFPRMIRLINQGYGQTRKVPHLVLAGASLDDVFVLVLFASFLRLATGEGMSAWSLVSLPLSIALGVLSGLLTGEVFTRLVKAVHMRDTVKVLIMASIGFLFIVLEEVSGHSVPFSGLVAVIAFAAMILKRHQVLAKRLVLKFEKIWVLAEIALFVLVGAALDITSAFDLGIMAAVFIILMLLIRSVGVLAALIKSGLPWRERLFVVFAYLPKATVQAAIGAVPLSMGLASGQTILTLAVLSIIITAPVGAVLVDLGHHKLLKADLEV
jgi:NhaP-type Na+/H+ or K+/H+ antiporter